MSRFEHRLPFRNTTDRLHGASACEVSALAASVSADGMPAGLQGVPAALSGSMPGQARELATLMYRIAYEAALSQVEHEANLRRLAAMN
jgi:hypothetical protein